ncbi:MAG: ABC transporter ATP-binding protein [Planctomycetota bacterium]
MSRTLTDSLQAAIQIQDVTHRYGELFALDGLSLDIESRQIFGLLGPNGSGKSTLFRLISTLVPIQRGSIRVFGIDVDAERDGVREAIGVVFQSPSLDRKLTVRENLEYQAALYGLSRPVRNERIAELVERMGVADRMHDRCEKLSGGLKRRVELAKGLIHRPRLLLLDEPSTGLDPSARLELWQALVSLKNDWGTTVVLTTHWIEEADKCDRLAILDRGRLVAMDTPDLLRRETTETVLSILSSDPIRTSEIMRCQFGWDAKVFDQTVRVVTQDSITSLAPLMDALGASALSITIGRPSLEDVFIRKTGKPFESR